MPKNKVKGRIVLGEGFPITVKIGDVRLGVALTKIDGETMMRINPEIELIKEVKYRLVLEKIS